MELAAYQLDSTVSLLASGEGEGKIPRSGIFRLHELLRVAILHSHGRE